MTSIQTLLEKRNTILTGKAGDPAVAHSRLDLSRMLANSYPSFNSFRLHLESRARKGHPRSFDDNPETQRIINKLLDLDYIVQSSDNKYKYSNHSSRAYLAGGWLEEFIFCAMQETQPDEVLYQQKIQWKVGDITGENEIDVIARKGEVLSLVSCKASHWNYRSHKQADREKLKAFLLETDYWDTHFSSGEGRAVLAVTQDLIDESRDNFKRSPTIFARAEILNVDIVSLDFFQWDVLVERLRQHWK